MQNTSGCSKNQMLRHKKKEEPEEREGPYPGVKRRKCGGRKKTEAKKITP